MDKLDQVLLRLETFMENSLEKTDHLLQKVEENHRMVLELRESMATRKWKVWNGEPGEWKPCWSGSLSCPG